MAPEDKDGIAQQLKSLQVHEAESVSVESRVQTSSGKTIRGKASAGRVKLVSTPTCLVIYLTRRDLDAEYPPYDLCEAIQAFYGIVEAGRAALLQQVLLPLDEASIAQLLERKGIVITETRADDGESDDVIEDIGDINGKGDPLLGFIREIEGAAAVDRVLTRRWEQNKTSEVGPLLAQFCRLDNQDASLLLPGEYLPRLGRRGAPCLDGAQILEYRGLQEGETLTQDILNGSSMVWPAVFVSSKEHSSVVVFGNEEEDTGEVDIELAFLGEYMVGSTSKTKVLC